MKNKKAIYVLLMILISLIVSWASYKDIFFLSKWFIEAKNRDHLGALQDFSHASKSQIRDYDAANMYYELGNFSWSIRVYEHMKNDWWNLWFRIFHNLWNAYYRLGEKSQISSRISLWQKALDFYQKALDQNTDLDKKETLLNYEFVKKKLDDLRKSHKTDNNSSTQQNSQSDGNKSWSGSVNQSKNSWSGSEQGDSKSWSGSESDKQDKLSTKQYTNSWNFNNLWKVGQSGSSDSSDGQLKWYSDYLKQFQKDNQQYFRNGWNSDSPDDIMKRMLNNFSQDPFFQNVIPGGQDWNTKDW